ncbi:MAG TPA: VOC family protein [Candidatus Sulfomarinibacteraceae bacterium]|nr:VOC family protein [Candidatus Sulfomarinibacteraceae bacterium]
MAVQPIPEGYHTVTPYLIVPDVDGQISFLQEAFDAEVRARMEGPDGRVMHAEVRIGDSPVMMGESSDEIPPMPAMLHLYVPDVDAVYEQALAAGATSVREPIDEFYGDRSGGVQDAFGNQWWLATHVEDVSEEEMMRRMEEMAQ